MHCPPVPEAIKLVHSIFLKPDMMKKIEVYAAPAGGWASLKGTAATFLNKDTLLKGGVSMRHVNQPSGGIKCPSCAWPDSAHAKPIDFCESGAKAVAFEATAKRIDNDFFAKHSVTELKTWSDFQLDQLGRLTHPMKYDPSTDHYVPIDWAQAYAEIGQFLRKQTTPQRAAFYTSGKVGNETAFCYQLMVREYGSNNFPDCSNMCHEPTSVGLSEQIGIGKATVIRTDFDHCDLILSFGHNPGTNHPRSLIALREAKKNGAVLVAVNPLRERSLERYRHPQSPVEMLMGKATELAADHFIQVKVGGDCALITGMIKAFLEIGTPDAAFIAEHTSDYHNLCDFVAAQHWDELEAAAGIDREQMYTLARIYDHSKNTIAIWGMGITQHETGLDNIHMIINLLLLKGNIGRVGTGACPVRGHSNVQGDRTMGIHEKPDLGMMDRIEQRFGFVPPRTAGMDVLATLQAMQAGELDFLMGLAGNFAKATPDTRATLRNLERLKMTVMVSISLNRSHLHHGQAAYILPTIARTEADHQDSGFQSITIEDSMSNVTLSRGFNPPASNTLQSETAIVAGIAQATLPHSRVPWAEFVADYDRIRDAISHVVNGFADFNARVRQPRGFYLGNAARERRWNTITQKAQFLVPQQALVPRILQQPDTLRLTTIRAHGQFNTTIYDMDDRYRGVYGERDVLFMHPEQMTHMGLVAGQRVDVTAVYASGDRVLNGLKLMPFDLPLDCVAAYYPEANDLIPLEHHVPRAHTPAYKSIPVRIRASV